MKKHILLIGEKPHPNEQQAMKVIFAQEKEILRFKTERVCLEEVDTKTWQKISKKLRTSGIYKELLSDFQEYSKEVFLAAIEKFKESELDFLNLSEKERENIKEHLEHILTSPEKRIRWWFLTDKNICFIRELVKVWEIRDIKFIDIPHQFITYLKAVDTYFEEKNKFKLSDFGLKWRAIIKGIKRKKDEKKRITILSQILSSAAKRHYPIYKKILLGWAT